MQSTSRQSKENKRTLTISKILENNPNSNCENDKYFLNPRFQNGDLLQKTRSNVSSGSLDISRDELSIGNKFGEGAFGIVSKGKWRGYGCVVKMLRDDMSQETSKVAHNCLLSELSILSGIGVHPNLVSFYGACLDDVDMPILVQEHIEGPNLQEYLDAKAFEFNLGSARVLRWSLDILSALHYLHDRDPVIMHRDLKPANVVLARNRRRLKLIDFGLAKCFERPRHDGPKLTRVHTMNISSPCYMAPEVVTSCVAGAAEYTEKADIYSAALIVWYLLTGRRPRRRTLPTERPDVRPAQKRWAELSEVVERMWAADAGARPSAGECVAALQGLRVPAPAGCASGCAMQ